VISGFFAFARQYETFFVKNFGAIDADAAAIFRLAFASGPRVGEPYALPPLAHSTLPR
jgi:hypothetical protein